MIFTPTDSYLAKLSVTMAELTEAVSDDVTLTAYSNLTVTTAKDAELKVTMGNDFNQSYNHGRD